VYVVSKSSSVLEREFALMVRKLHDVNTISARHILVYLPLSL
jgi:hypothetical protein